MNQFVQAELGDKGAHTRCIFTFIIDERAGSGVCGNVCVYVCVCACLCACVCAHVRACTHTLGEEGL